MASPRRSGAAPAARRPRQDAAETRARILDAAEALFIELGFAATSVRAIAARAGVNLAAAHYHFGSKEALLGAVVHRRIAPIQAERERGLDVLEARRDPPTPTEILEVFFAPLADAAARATVPRVIARLYGEPQSVSLPLLEREFGALGRRFADALERALPGVGRDELQWRFHFVIGAMIHLLSFERPPIFEDSGNEGDGLAPLLAFAVAGIEQGAAVPTPPRSPQEERR